MNCQEMRSWIAQMPAGEMRSLPLEGHLAECARCQTYLQDLLHLSSGLEHLVIPRPSTMSPPTLQRAANRRRIVTLLAATLTMLLVGALAAVVYKNYALTEEPSGPGSRDALFYSGKHAAKKVKTQQNGQLGPGQSTPSPSNPSR